MCLTASRPLACTEAERGAQLVPLVLALRSNYQIWAVYPIQLTSDFPHCSLYAFWRDQEGGSNVAVVLINRRRNNKLWLQIPFHCVYTDQLCVKCGKVTKQEWNTERVGTAFV